MVAANICHSSSEGHTKGLWRVGLGGGEEEDTVRLRRGGGVQAYCKHDLHSCIRGVGGEGIGGQGIGVQAYRKHYLHLMLMHQRSGGGGGGGGGQACRKHYLHLMLIHRLQTSKKQRGWTRSIADRLNKAGNGNDWHVVI